MGLLIQKLAARLGVASGSHLAELCRVEYPGWARLVLWVMTEIAIIGADVQQVIGSTIAFRLLSNGWIPLWAGVLITGIDWFLFLFLENFGVWKLELLFCVFIGIMEVSFAWMFGETNSDVQAVASGALASLFNSTILQDLSTAVDKVVGIVGAVIMPHNIFLHSALVQSRNIDTSKKSRVREALRYYNIESAVALFISFLINLCIMAIFAKAFYGKEEAGIIGLANAGEYLQRRYGGGFFPIFYIWAIGLLAAGQSSTMTGTYTVSNTRVMGVFVISKVTNVRHGLETLSSTINLYALSLLLCITQLRTQLVDAKGYSLEHCAVGNGNQHVPVVCVYFRRPSLVYRGDSGLRAATTFYIAFIVYLVLEPAQEDGNWVYIKRKFITRMLAKSRSVTSLVHVAPLVSSKKSGT
uniref:Uncharacterized protein n=1 Tax=Physcomitrium patens TaxID=3218 RepID=A0A7I4DLT1_PHYPA